MNLKQLKEWLDKLPEEALEWEVVLGEVGKVDEEYFYRKDSPIVALDLDTETNEVLIMRYNDKPITIEDNENE